MLAAATTVLLWASAFVAIRSVGSYLSAGPIALGRIAVATVALAPLAMRRRAYRLPGGRARRPLIAYGAMWFAGYNVALNAAERHVDAGTAALLVNVAPLLIAVGAGFLLGEGFPAPLLAGGVVALGGVAVMAAGAGRGATHGTAAVDPAGVALGLLAAGLYAGAVLIQKSLLRELDAVTVTWLGCVVGLVALLSFAGQLAGQLPSAPAGAVLGTVYLGALPTAVAFTTWAYALRRLPAGRLSPIGYLVTVVSVLLSWLLLGEVPTGTALAGGALCVLGVAIGRRGAGRPVPLRKWTPPVRRSRASRSAASTLGG